uniref:Uncharacterized protein n=1 Tax=Triticum urartu TaxID=4572 RepID=A0A8R7QT11_TRIUA
MGSVVLKASTKSFFISPSMQRIASPVRCLFGATSGETSIGSSNDSAAISAPVLAPSPLA